MFVIVDIVIKKKGHLDSFVFTVEAPIAKATISVMEVTVTETPALFRVKAILCTNGSLLSINVKLIRTELTLKFS
jgi:hypothetical protein